MTLEILGLVALLLWAGHKGRVFWRDFKVAGLFLGGYLVLAGIAGNLRWDLVGTALMFTLGGWLVVALVRGEDDDEDDYDWSGGSDVKPGGHGR